MRSAFKLDEMLFVVVDDTRLAATSGLEFYVWYLRYVRHQVAGSRHDTTRHEKCLCPGRNLDYSEPASLYVAH